MSDMVTTGSKSRIDWIDIAKAIAILAMIEGHSVAYGGHARNLIYSFHMPIFFVLTGFTIKPVSNLSDFFRAVKRDFIKIILPCVATQAINGLISYWVYDEMASESLHLRLEQLWWGSAIDVYGHSCLGMIWFLVALFWTKQLYYIITLIFPNKYNGALFLLFAVAGKMLSLYGKYLPQSLDVVCVSVLLIYIGNVLRRNYSQFEKYQFPITASAFLIWTACWEKGIYIELGGRWYPWFALGLLEAVCGGLCVFTLAQALEAFKPAAWILKNIGRHTLLILCVSHIDWLALNIWGYKPMWQTLVLRPAIVLAGTFAVVGILWLVKKILKLEK